MPQPRRYTTHPSQAVTRLEIQKGGRRSLGANLFPGGKSREWSTHTLWNRKGDFSPTAPRVDFVEVLAAREMMNVLLARQGGSSRSRGNKIRPFADALGVSFSPE